MNGKAQTIRRTLQALALIATIAAVAVPAASAGSLGGPGIVPSKLGSPDPRESQGNVLSPGLVPSRLGSQDPRDTVAASSVSQSSIVARQLGSQDPRDADAMQNPVGTVDETSSNGGFDFGNLEIGIVGAVCGLLLLTALGIGARQVRHTRHRLGSA